METTFSQRNKPSLDALRDLLVTQKDSGKAKIVVFAGAAISLHPPSRLPAANAMLRATIRLLLQDPILGKTLHESALCWRLYRLIWRSCASANRHIPPEMIYDAIYEFAGKKVFSALDCLKSNEPNPNHRILAALLEKGFIDHIITTNFDTLIEQSLTTAYAPSSVPDGKRVWKIHGDLQTPTSMATTMRRIGQTAFDEGLVKQLRDLLEGSHVIFIGYSGMDPDLMPAFKTATMKSVYWCVYDPEELNIKNENAILHRDPCKTIAAKGTQIHWIVGDLQKELLFPVSASLLNGDTDFLASVTNSKGSDKIDRSRISPLQKSMEQWEHSYFRRLSAIEKARAMLQILYSIALYSPASHRAWILLLETADAMEGDKALWKGHNSEFARDLHAFRAEAYLKLGERVQQLYHTLVAQILPQPVPLQNDPARQLEEILNDLYESPLPIENFKPGPVSPAGQLYMHARNHLTPILPLAFQDALQVQALLNASTILVFWASPMSEERAHRNLEGAKKMLEQGIQITAQAKMDNQRRDLLKARCCSNLAVLYIESGNPPEALQLFEEAERLFKKSGDLYSYAGTCINLGSFLIDMYKGFHIQMYKDEAEKYWKNATLTLNAFPNPMLNDKVRDLERMLSEAD